MSLPFLLASGAMLRQKVLRGVEGLRLKDASVISSKGHLDHLQ